MYVGNRMRHKGRSRSLRRYFGIQDISCAVLRRWYRHLPERVKQQYKYVQDIPRPPTDVVQMRDSDCAGFHRLSYSHD